MTVIENRFHRNATTHASRRALLTPLLLGALAVITACSDSTPTDTAPRAAEGIIVLDGFIQPGLTLLADTGGTGTSIPFGASDEFDAGGFNLRNDTVVAASSRGAGDQLYIAALSSVGTSVRRVQMPATSNPGGARLLVGSGGRSLVGVPLRDSAMVMLVSIAGTGAPTFERIADLGTCPTDVFQYGGDVWVVDANANCAVDYTPTGPMRLIRVPAAGGARQVLSLPALRGSSGSAIVRDGVAYISAGGDADFSSFPYVLRAGGAITRVDLQTGTVLGSRAMPTGSYGANTKLGLDGKLYVSFYEDLINFSTRTIAFEGATLTPSGVRVAGADWLADASGSPVGCSSGIADGLGRLYCLESRAGSATFVLVYAPDGSLLREFAAGQGGVDIGLR